MQKEKNKKELYKTPTCIMFFVKTECPFCETSVSPKIPGTVEEKWKDNEDEDGGEIDL